MSAEKGSKPAVFEGRRIRKTFHEGEWWFAVIDIVEVLPGSSMPKRYWSNLKRWMSTSRAKTWSGRISAIT